MIVISGSPRSGTSLTTSVVFSMLGQERLIGQEFPQRERFEQGPRESDKMWELRQIMMDSKDPRWKDDWEKIKNMNRNGFWECPFTVQGIRYAHAFKPLLKEIVEKKGKAGEQKVCKIVSNGLINSDPQYIDRIIYIARDPYKVAKSQEALQRGMMPKEQKGDTFKIKTPQLFMESTYQAARFFYENPDIPYKVIEYDKLVDDPVSVCEELREFMGEGDVQAGASKIKKSERRSEKEVDENPLWPEAEKLYQFFLNDEMWNAVRFFESEAKENAKRSETAMFHCPRIGHAVSGGTCENCLKDRSVAARFKVTAETRKIDWRNQPCLYECGITKNGEGKEIEQSIEQNHWIGAEF